MKRDERGSGSERDISHEGGQALAMGLRRILPSVPCRRRFLLTRWGPRRACRRAQLLRTEEAEGTCPRRSGEWSFRAGQGASMVPCPQCTRVFGLCVPRGGIFVREG